MTKEYSVSCDLDGNKQDTTRATYFHFLLKRDGFNVHEPHTIARNGDRILVTQDIRHVSMARHGWGFFDYMAEREVA